MSHEIHCTLSQSSFMNWLFGTFQLVVIIDNGLKPLGSLTANGLGYRI